MQTRFDAVIIGAGPAGSAAAILLARAGLAVALVEKQGFPRRKVCGECIAASNLPLLDALGIGAAFEANAGPELRQVALMRAQTCIVADLPPAPHQRYRWGRALGRATLDALLLEQARSSGAHVLQPWRLSAIEDAGDVQRCSLQAVDSGARMALECPLVIAANGSWEPLPATRGALAVVRKASDLFAFKANFRATSLDPGLLPVLSFDGGYGGMVVADDGVTTVACCIRRDRLRAARRAAPGRCAGDVVEELLVRQCGGVRRALHGAARIGPWIAAGPLDTGVRIGSDDTVLRIGNAAGEAHPILGEGLSMALQSAFILSTHVLAAPSPAQLPRRVSRREIGARYAAQWRRAFAPRILLAATFAHAAMGTASGPALSTLVRAWPRLLTYGARWGGKVHNAAAR